MEEVTANDKESEFILVKSKRRLRKNKKKVFTIHYCANYDKCDDDSGNNIESIMRKLTQAQNLIKDSEQLTYFLTALDKSISLLNEKYQLKNGFFSDIVCYGIGRFSQSHQAMHQLALLIEFKNLYNIKVHIFDPVFNPTEKEILRKLDFNIISINEEGKRKVIENTLFYLPHCPRELLNNTLWSNWGLSLSKCIIIGNRHSNIIGNTPSSSLINFQYITKITPALEELEIPNLYRYNDIFNDFAIHCFPIEKLKNLSDDIWKFNEIPVYSKENSEFIGFSSDISHWKTDYQGIKF